MGLIMIFLMYDNFLRVYQGTTHVALNTQCLSEDFNNPLEPSVTLL